MITGTVPNDVARLAPHSADAGFLARVRARQNPHSLFLLGAGALLLATLVVDLFVHRENLRTDVLVGLLLVGATLATTVGVLGSRFPRWLGLFAVGLVAAALLYFVSPAGDSQSAVSSLQELPIIALYLGWFVRPPLNRVLMGVILGLILAVMLVNPVFAVRGDLGVAPAVQSLIITYFCFEVGAALWRRSEHEVTTDPLTGALNRAGFMSRMRAEITRSLRHGSPLTLVVVDFDLFKQLNDSQGHDAGDAALRATVEHWRKRLRVPDAIGRTGGDEFAILLEGTDATAAQQIMLRTREGAPHPYSWGVSQLRDGDDVERLFDRADERLYAVKRSRE